MPGMRSGLNLGNPLLVAAFRSALLHQGLIALLVFGVLALAWVSVREWRLGEAAGAGLGQGGKASRASGLPGPGAGGRASNGAGSQDDEPSWRMLLRVGFGLLWLFDGLLQAQPSMVVGLPSQVIQPGADSSPAWVQHLVNWAGTAWSYHPVQAAAATVWIQAGIGCWLLAARRGRWSRLAGLASLGWGLIVWVFGESFGQIFAPGLTVLFGAPGAAAFYCAAGALIALPSRYWRAPWLGRTMLAALGLFIAGMAVLQAWPGRGFWQGRLHDGGGTLTGMIREMAQTPQPALLAGWVRGFASFTAAHGFAVNMFAVVALAIIGTALLIGAVLPAVLAGRGGGGHLLLRAAVIAAVVLCLADWVLIEDIGIFGGLGTDPNSMIPLALLLVAGYLAVAPAPARATASDPVAAHQTGMAPEPAVASGTSAVTGPAAAHETGVAPEPAVASGTSAVTGPAMAHGTSAVPEPAIASGTSARQDRGGADRGGADRGGADRGGADRGGADREPPGRVPAGWRRGWLGRLSPRRLAGAFGAADARTVAAAWALGVTVIGAFPLAAAAANRSADPVIAQAIDGSAAALNFPAPGFQLTDQDGRAVSLAGLRGKVVLLTFLDPVCTSDCPLIAQEFRAADQLLGAKRRDVVLVAVAANPVYYTTAYTRAFNRQEGLTHLPNWKFLSGPLPELKRVWHDYYFTAQIVPAGGMVLHGDIAYVIDAAGRTRTELNFDPGPGTAASQSSFAAELADAAIKAMKPS
jgi:cytochrome oxidase Cu insertion factor (SCO1/SenC/PrrC family)